MRGPEAGRDVEREKREAPGSMGKLAAHLC